MRRQAITNKIKNGKIGVGAALAALAFMAGCAPVSDGDDKSLGVADEAIVTVPVGTRLSCSVSASGVTGMRRVVLVVDKDLRTCYRYPVLGDVPASQFVASCHEVGRSIGCEHIRDV